MPTKCFWVIHGSLTSERKASTSPSSFINHSTLLLNRALKRQAPCLYMHVEVRALNRLRTRRRKGLRAVEVIIHDHSRFQRDINDVTGVPLSLSLSLSLSLLLLLLLTKVTDAQYRKRFRASYNKVSPWNLVHWFSMLLATKCSLGCIFFLPRDLVMVFQSRKNGLTCYAPRRTWWSWASRRWRAWPISLLEA